MHGSQCGDSPKTLCSTEDRPSSIHRSVICIMLKNCPSILDHQEGNSSSAFGICCGAHAIGVLDFGNCRRRRCKREKKHSAVAASLCEAQPWRTIHAWVTSPTGRRLQGMIPVLYPEAVTPVRRHHRGR